MAQDMLIRQLELLDLNCLEYIKSDEVRTLRALPEPRCEGGRRSYIKTGNFY